MAVGDTQRLIIDVLSDVLQQQAETDVSFYWLKNKHIEEDFRNEALNINLFPDIQKIFQKLNGDQSGMEKKGARTLKPDCYFGGKYNFIFEFDELQHFTSFKKTVLLLYPRNLRYGFDLDQYINYCDRYAAQAIKKGPAGYRKPKDEFPYENGRAAQRAFFDAFRDLLPSVQGLNPTLRISQFEVEGITGNNEIARNKVKAILVKRGILS